MQSASCASCVGAVFSVEDIDGSVARIGFFASDFLDSGVDADFATSFGDPDLEDFGLLAGKQYRGALILWTEEHSQLVLSAGGTGGR